MAINLSAYDTTTCGGFPISKIKDEIGKAQLMGGFHTVIVKPDPYIPEFPLHLLEGGNSGADTIGFFKHPVLAATELTAGKLNVFLDVRDYGRYDGIHGMFGVRNGGEYVFHIRRAILNHYLIDGRIETLRDLSSVPIKAYAALISQSIARRFSLDPAEQATIAAISGYFYLCLFTDETSLSEHDMTLTIGKLSTDLKLPVQVVKQAVEELEVLHDIESLCAAIHSRLGNMSLQNLNIGTFLACITGNWFGTNSREILGVALEHIPTWLVVVESCLSSRTYQRSTLAKIVQKLDRNEALKNYSRSLNAIIGSGSIVYDGDKPLSSYAMYAESF